MLPALTLSLLSAQFTDTKFRRFKNEYSTGMEFVVYTVNDTSTTLSLGKKVGAVQTQDTDVFSGWMELKFPILLDNIILVIQHYGMTKI